MTSYLGNTAKSLEMVPSMFGMLVEITAQLMDIADRKLTPAVIQVLFVESDLFFYFYNRLLFKTTRS